MKRHSDTEMIDLGWRFLWQRANVVALQLTLSGEILQANVYASTLSGIELRGRSMRDLVVDFDTEAAPDRLWQPTETVRMVNVKTASGLPQTLYATVWPMADGLLWFGQVDSAEQEVLREELLVLNHELSQMSRELELKNAELARLDALKNQFLSIAAYDLLRPVGLILSCSESIHESAGSIISSQQLRYLEGIRSAADHMQRIIADFLDVSKMEAGHSHRR